MPNTRKINVGGKIVDATPIPVTDAHEPWYTVVLEDGTMIKARFVVYKIWRIEGQYNNDGSPSYWVQHTPIITADAPEELRKPLEGTDDQTTT